MSNSDPLLRALADGDPHCPDGEALVTLGKLIRKHSAVPGTQSDISDDVLGRLRDVDQESADSIDAYYDNDVDDPTLDRLAGLVRSVGPKRVDLTANVMRRISASARFGAFANDERENRDGLDGRSRWRIWSAVIAGHVAALLALAIFELGYYTGSEKANDTGTASIAANGHTDGSGARVVGNNRDHAITAPTLPTNLPKSWDDIRTYNSDLFLLRRFPELRDNARVLYGMQASGAVVDTGITWLRAQQARSSGAFLHPNGVSATGKSGNSEHDLATHSLATLVLLGEGLGDKALSADTRKALDWLRIQLGDTELIGDGTGTDRVLNSVGQVTSGLMCLALVEGSLLYGDLSLRAVAEASLQAIDRNLPMQPGAAGLGGFTLLACETAYQGGMRVPNRLLRQVRRSLAQSLPTVDDDAGRVGLAAFARCIYGLGANDSTITQIAQLRHLLPGSTSGRADPLGWFFATCAMREAGETEWQQWSHALEAQLIPLFEADGHVAAHHIRYGETGGDIFATSLALLNLQAPYRYLPLIPSGK